MAGTLEGVFRTRDGGASWERISPSSHGEIRDVESVAIDPIHPEVIYIGTWHLPWKTSDGGAHWVSIKKGIIDDSDVFSIVIDRSHPDTLYLSACTGIYRSDTAGAEWTKIQGIPYSSRRTRVLALDLRAQVTLYAGTTEGLWQTKDGGASWHRLTHHSWVINAIVVDSRDAKHFYLGMDNAGIMETRDGGARFAAANRGFAQRQIANVIADPAQPGRFYAALVQDGSLGGVVYTDNGGLSWQSLGAGLEGHDVKALLVVTQPSWRLLAGTPEGIFEFSKEQPVWKDQNQSDASVTSAVAGKTLSVWRLFQREAGEPIYAASSAGLLASSDARRWSRVAPSTGRGEVLDVISAGAHGQTLLVATSAGLQVSNDTGRTWRDVRLDPNPQVLVTRLAAMKGNPDVVFAGTNVGLFRSTDGGTDWEKFGHGLPFAAIHEIAVGLSDPGEVLVASDSGLFQSLDGGSRYARIEDAGIEDLPIRVLAAPAFGDDSILAGSAYNGIFLYRPAQAASIPAPEEVSRRASANRIR